MKTLSAGAAIFLSVACFAASPAEAQTVYGSTIYHGGPAAVAGRLMYAPVGLAYGGYGGGYGGYYRIGYACSTDEGYGRRGTCDGAGN
jgi:hypothetical protein